MNTECATFPPVLALRTLTNKFLAGVFGSTCRVAVSPFVIRNVLTQT